MEEANDILGILGYIAPEAIYSSGNQFYFRIWKNGVESIARVTLLTEKDELGKCSFDVEFFVLGMTAKTSGYRPIGYIR